MEVIPIEDLEQVYHLVEQVEVEQEEVTHRILMLQMEQLTPVVVEADLMDIAIHTKEAEDLE